MLTHEQCSSDSEPHFTRRPFVREQRRWSSENGRCPLGIVEPYAIAAHDSPDWDYYELASPHDAVRVIPAVASGRPRASVLPYAVGAMAREEPGATPGLSRNCDQVA